MILLIKSLWGYLDKRHKKNFSLIFIFMIAVSLIEAVSIGAVLPFIGILTSPKLVYNQASGSSGVRLPIN